ncbi:MAG: hypothetical protein GY869_09595 [Planctomycetes bacterium]|nr:hypothetical protein [Planctomycetota bacterium]
MSKKNRINVPDIIARKRQKNNKIFAAHRQHIMPQVEALKSKHNEGVRRSSDYDLSNLISQAYSLINTELDRYYHNLETVRRHSEQLKEDDIVEKYLEAEQAVLSNIDRLEQKRQELDGLVADVGTQVKQIITEIGGFDDSEARGLTRPDDTPGAYGGPDGVVRVDKQKDPDGTKTFEKALAAKAAGMGVSPDVIAKAMKNGS